MFFIGDQHGRFDSYNYLINKMQLPGGRIMDCSLQVGDMGVFNEKDLPKIATDDRHKFFVGNHDNRQLASTHPNCIGDYGYNEKMKMFWTSGGYSIDKADRMIGVSWWEDEELNWEKLQCAIDLYSMHKPKIMVSHECPSAIKPYALAANPFSQLYGKGKCVSRTENALQTMFEIHKPDVWIYGHYHFRVDENVQGTRFVGLGDHRADVQDQYFEMPELTW